MEGSFKILLSEADSVSTYATSSLMHVNGRDETHLTLTAKSHAGEFIRIEILEKNIDPMPSIEKLAHGILNSKKWTEAKKPKS